MRRRTKFPQWLSPMQTRAEVVCRTILWPRAAAAAARDWGCRLLPWRRAGMWAVHKRCVKLGAGLCTRPIIMNRMYACMSLTSKSQSSIIMIIRTPKRNAEVISQGWFHNPSTPSAAAPSQAAEYIDRTMDMFMAMHCSWYTGSDHARIVDIRLNDKFAIPTT